MIRVKLDSWDLEEKIHEMQSNLYGCRNGESDALGFVFNNLPFKVISSVLPGQDENGIALGVAGW